MHAIGPYRIVEELARGGAGVVYRARRGEHEVALKLLRAGSDATPDQRARFERERQAMARVRHPGIVAVHDAGEHAGLLYLAMDLVTGESLGALLQRVGKLEPRRAAQLALAMADALAAAHAEGILHRDLKPENVLLDDEGRVRLTDFGLARLGGRSSLTRSGHFMGSPGYSAPELATGDAGQIGPATDVYGVGATLYALLTGDAPCEGATLNELIVATLERRPRPPSESSAGLDPRLEAICLRCLEKDPAQRFPSAAALSDALRGWLDGRAAPRERSLRAAPLLLLPVLAVTASAAWLALSGPATPTEDAPAVAAAPEVEPSPAVEPPRPVLAWPPEVGATGTYRLRLENTTVSGEPATIQGAYAFTVAQRVTRVEGQRVEVEAELRGVKVDYADELRLHYDTSEENRGSPLGPSLDALVGRSLRWVQDATSGEVLELDADLRFPQRSDLDPGDPFLGTVLPMLQAAFSPGHLRGILHSVWSVFPAPPPGRTSKVEGVIYAAYGHVVPCTRVLSHDGERLTVEGLMPRELVGDPTYLPFGPGRRGGQDMPPMQATDLQGEVQVGPRGELLAHSMVLRLRTDRGTWDLELSLERLQD